MLPLMQHQAGRGVAEAGWLAAINYAGNMVERKAKDYEREYHEYYARV